MSSFVSVPMFKYGVLMEQSCTRKKTRNNIESFLTEKIKYDVSFGNIFSSTDEGYNRVSFKVNVPLDEYSSANKPKILSEIEQNLKAALEGFSQENSAKIILEQYSEIQSLRDELAELKSVLASLEMESNHL